MRAIKMSTLAAAVGTADLELFRQRFGQAFLVLTATRDELQPPAREWQATLDGGGRQVGGSAPQRLHTIDVFPLRCDDQPWNVSVGRVEPNDVVLPDASVSVYHALLSRDAGGRFLLADVGSTNGTFVNDFPARDEEGGIEVRSSDTVRFGSVTLTFLLPREVLELTQTLNAISPPRPAPRPAQLVADQLFDDLPPASTGTVPLPENLLSYFDALQLVRKKQYRAAETMLEQVLSQAPDNHNARVWLLVARARRLQRDGDQQAAAGCYRELLRLDPDHEEALRALGQSP